MSFFEKHIFFPKRFGIAPYFWLVFLIPTIYSLFPLTSWFDWLFILLLVIFLKAYRDGYEVHKFLTGDVFLQLLIACLFGIFQKKWISLYFRCLGDWLPASNQTFILSLFDWLLCKRHD